MDYFKIQLLLASNNNTKKLFLGLARSYDHTLNNNSDGGRDKPHLSIIVQTRNRRNFFWIAKKNNVLV